MPPVVRETKGGDKVVGQQARRKQKNGTTVEELKSSGKGRRGAEAFKVLSSSLQAILPIREREKRRTSSLKRSAMIMMIQYRKCIEQIELN